MNKAKIIKKLVLELEGRTVTLNWEEARALFDALEELFGKKIVEYRYHYNQPYVHPKPYWGGHTYSLGASVAGTQPLLKNANVNFNEQNGSMTLSALKGLTTS